MHAAAGKGYTSRGRGLHLELRIGLVFHFRVLLVSGTRRKVALVEGGSRVNMVD